VPNVASMRGLMEGRARTVLAVIVVLLILGVPLAVLFASGGDGDDPRDARAIGPELRLEPSPTLPELIVYVEPATNEPERAGGARSVTLRCVDADGRLVAAQDEPWPFTDTDSGTLDPHAHMTLEPGLTDQVSSCRLVGTEPPVEGALP
jgi:hypothetical protein